MDRWGVPGPRGRGQWDQDDFRWVKARESLDHQVGEQAELIVYARVSRSVTGTRWRDAMDLTRAHAKSATSSSRFQVYRAFLADAAARSPPRFRVVLPIHVFFSDHKAAMNGFWAHCYVFLGFTSGLLGFSARPRVRL